MRSTFKVVAIALTILATTSLLSLRDAERPSQIIKDELIGKAVKFEKAVNQLRNAPTNLLQQRFREVRYAYKQMEWATEYFDPITARVVNGPPVPEAELNGQVILPSGLQVLEQYLFPYYNSKQTKNINAQLVQLAANAAEFKEAFQKDDLQDWQILDAAKQEVFRVEVLGLNNFDDPLLKNCFDESAMALKSVESAVKRYDTNFDCGTAIKYLQKTNNFNGFDRAGFILQYANPLTEAIVQLHHQLHLPDIRYNRLLNQDAVTLFDKNAFNRNAFTNAPEDSVTNDKIALGKKLFFDPVLSGNGKRSCASCHQPKKVFTDGLLKNLDITGKKFIARNTPTLINAALQPAQFYDLRSPSLEDQANDVVQNKDEMHGDMKIVVNKLWKDPEYQRLFKRTYPSKCNAEIDTFEVMNALASYIRSLTALNSKFDRYMQGDRKALNVNELKGFNLFMGKARCSTCHYLPLFNGALPPRYMQMEAEVIGVPEIKNGKQIDPDPGTYGVQPMGFNRYAFKTTSVRNAAKTAPYMHNGVFNTLNEVVAFYNKGGGYGSGIRLANQTLDKTPLNLTKVEKHNLILFIKTLNSQL